MRVFKESQIRLRLTTELVGDSGYQGVKKLHENSDHARERFRPLGASWNQEGAFYGQEVKHRIRVGGNDL
jgi:hypothetical protein